jgi:hypothetical protein
MKNQNARATIIWPKDIYLLLCRIARSEGLTLSGFIRAAVAPRLREWNQQTNKPADPPKK